MSRALGFARLAAAAMLALLAGASPAEVDQKRVLILWSGRVDLPVNNVVNQVIRSRLFQEFGAGVDIRFEHIEPSPDLKDQQEALRDYIRRKYAATPRFDLLIAVADTATDFVRLYGAELFPGVPAVWWGTEMVREGWEVGRPATGVVIVRDPAATLELILHVHPATREIVVIAGGSPYDVPEYESEVRRSIVPYEKRLTITYVVGVPLEDIRARVAHLSERTVILWVAMRGDGAGRRLVNVDALSTVATAANVPTYGMVGSILGAGIVGGAISSQEAASEDTADLAVRVLNGARAQDIPIVYKRPVPMADWRQLQRWRIPESRLPPGTIVVNKDLTLWEEQKGRIAGIAALCVGQTILIVALLLQRRRWRRAESLRNAVLASLNDHVALLEADGTVVEVNDSWRRFVHENGPHVRGHTLPPENYLEACRRAEDPQDDVVTESRNGLAEVLRGAQRQFRAEYSCPTRTGVRWFTMTAEPLRRPSGGAVVTHTDITDRIEAEHAAQEQRRQLAHLGRVAMLGELSGTLAHELNQPLTAILSNAEAARRMLAAAHPDLDEVRDSLDDIVAADRRASDVIRRLRAMLKRTETHSQPIDVNEIAREVIDLAHADLLARGVTVALRLQDGLPEVAGDRVQLQQVLLNLVLNGCDAMVGRPPEQRELTVASGADEQGAVVICVQDRGTGIAAGDVDRIFEPFFTSKAEGLGLGLAICRTIATGHGGRLWATNNEGEPGATLHLALPSAGSRSLQPAAS